MPPAPMQTVDWFPKPNGPKAGHDILSSALKAAVGIGACALFYVRGHLVLAGVAAGLAVVFFGVSMSAGGRALLAKVFGFVGEWAGRIVGSVLLTIIFVLVLTPVRLVRRLAGIDDLHMRSHKERSFWLVCDSEEHKRRYAGAMFATEAPQEGGGRRGVLVLAALAALLVVSEVGLRIEGFGRPLTYLSEPHAGYYPAPHQKTTWRGARLETNGTGMRAPERAATKSQGMLRVLSLATDGGLRVDQDAIYARGLEKKLAEKGGGRAVEVWNADVEGWGPASARGFVAAFGTFDADVTVVVLAPGSLERPLQSLLYTGFAPAERPPRLALEEKILSMLWDYRAGRTVNDAAYFATLRDEGVAACVNLAQTLRDRGIEALFVAVPARGGQAAGEKEALATLRAGVEGAGGHVHELPIAFAEGALDHETAALTAEGHAALAETIAADLAAESWKTRAWLAGQGP